MTTVFDAIAWKGSGSDVIASLFVVTDRVGPLEIDVEKFGFVPSRTRTYELEDERSVLKGAKVLQYDVYFDAPPKNFARFLTECLGQAIANGASVAWFGFEGSFSFDHFLTRDISDQVYAIAASSGETHVAMNDELRVGPLRGALLERLRASLI